jgi:hypothetical protein
VGISSLYSVGDERHSAAGFARASLKNGARIESLRQGLDFALNQTLTEA